MPTLRDIQRQFCNALFEQDPTRIENEIRDEFISMKTGLEVYRNNVFTNLREALRTLFPVINKLVGEEFFNFASEHFIHEHPSPAGDLNQYGEKFSEFLASFEPAIELVYLPDVARLEWAIHLVYHARNSAKLDRQRLALIPAVQYGNLHFKFNPACMLVRSTYPILDIWRVNQPGFAGDVRVELDRGGVSLLVARRDNRIVMDTLSAGDTAFLTAITRHHAPLSIAYAEAMHTDPDFSLNRAMAVYVQNDTLIDFDIYE